MNEHVHPVNDEGAWRALARELDDTRFIASWLKLQLDAIDNCTSGLVWRVRGASPLAEPDAMAPAGPAPHPALAALAEGTRKTGDVLLEPLAERAGCRLAYPIKVEGKLLGVIAVEISGAADKAALKVATRSLQWGAGWFAAWAMRHRGGDGRAASPISADAFRLLASALDAPNFKAAATTLAVELTQCMGLDRSSVGVRRSRRMRAIAVSHAVQADARMAAVRRIEAAMEEAADQRSIVVLPAPEAGLVTSEAERARSGTDAIAAIPLVAQGKTIGAMLLERARPFSDAELTFLRAVATFAGPLLHEKRLNSRPVVAKLGSAILAVLGRLLGPAHLRTKLAALALAALCATAILMEAPYQISAPAVIEAEARRVVSAPFDGYLARARRRAGDTVRSGDELGALDDTDLTLERSGLIADREQRASELQSATARYELARAQIAKAELEQIEAKLRLVEQRLARSVLRAPIDGIVLTGDLSQSIGEPVRSGAALFELAPQGAFRLIVKVDETEIADVQPGQRGRVVLAALPERVLDFDVVRATPVLEAKDGRNYYRVEARLAADMPALRPGFEGRARIDAGERALWWLWSRDIVRWLRLQLWTHMP